MHTSGPLLPLGPEFTLLQLEHNGQFMGWVKNALLRCEVAPITEDEASLDREPECKI
jgi:hypothetical protein